MINTKSYLKEIISHREIFGEDGDLGEAAKLIGGIPSVTLIYHISRINLILYLDQPGSEGVLKQNKILNSYLPYCRKEWTPLFVKAFEDIRLKGNWQTIFWEYSNMLFYDLVFSNHNDEPLRDFADDENERFLKAYLMVNSVVNNGFSISPEDIENALAENEIERIIVPNFTYQRDYISNHDFKNQLSRGIHFFEYLENDPVFKTYVQGYYDELKIQGFKEMFRLLLMIFVQFELQNAPNLRRHQIGFEGLEHLVNFSFVDQLAINHEIDSFKNDSSFSMFRKYPLYRFVDKGYLLLSVNFFLDRFFKAQVFAFKAFIEKNGFKGNFQSKKGKDFMEDIYFRKLMRDCFSHLFVLDGDQATTNTQGELCDFYVRMGHKIMLIEFKDVLLNAKVKSNADETEMYKELNIKFNKNQNNSAKGIRQLLNASLYLQKTDLVLDPLDRTIGLQIYPVVVYTDLSFGNEGINKIMNDKFAELCDAQDFGDMRVEGVTFVNLNYFEHHEEYLCDGLVDIFDMLDGYQQHVKLPINATASFETYSRAYFDESQLPDIPPGSKLKDIMKDLGINDL